MKLLSFSIVQTKQATGIPHLMKIALLFPMWSIMVFTDCGFLKHLLLFVLILKKKMKAQDRFVNYEGGCFCIFTLEYLKSLCKKLLWYVLEHNYILLYLAWKPWWNSNTIGTFVIERLFVYLFVLFCLYKFWPKNHFMTTFWDWPCKWFHYINMCKMFVL